MSRNVFFFVFFLHYHGKRVSRSGCKSNSFNPYVFESLKILVSAFFLSFAYQDVKNLFLVAGKSSNLLFTNSSFFLMY
jgi:F0F1-type ATP synthase assembly protein I